MRTVQYVIKQNTQLGFRHDLKKKKVCRDMMTNGTGKSFHTKMWNS